MKHLLFTSLCALLFATTSFAQISAAQWAKENEKTLAPIACQNNLAAILNKGSAGFNEIANKIVTAGKDDPVAATTIAQLTQYVQRHPEVRPAYTSNLLAAAQKAKEPDMICFWLCQLRWCGLPCQLGAIEAFQKSQYKCVRDLAEMTIQSIKGQYNPQPKWCSESRSEAFSRELSMLPVEARYPRCVKFFEDADPGCRLVAIRSATMGGGERVTRMWMDTYANQRCPVKKSMLIDMFGERGDRLASPLLVSALADSEQVVVSSASAALLKFDRGALIAALPAWLCRENGSNYTTLKNTLDRLTTGEAAPTLMSAYAKAPPSCKRLALDFLRARMVKEALPLGLSAIDQTDTALAISGWRLLREIACKDQANTLIQKAFVAKGRVAPEAQTAIAVASRRGEGAYQVALLKIINGSDKAQKAQALELTPRLGGAELLKQVEAGLDSDDAAIQGACARALSDWEGNATIPLLMRSAIAGKSKRVQALTLRGAMKKLTKDVAPYYLKDWQAVKTLAGNDENRKQLGACFMTTVNVAKGKPVKTNAATEGNNVPANMTDGTLDKQWHAHTTPAAAVVDLGKVEPISGLHVTFYFADNRTYTYNLELSTDGKTWKKVAGNEKAPKRSTKAGETIHFAETPARYARLNVLKNSANPAVHVAELELLKKVQQ